MYRRAKVLIQLIYRDMIQSPILYQDAWELLC